jgi:hypothetical protein
MRRQAKYIVNGALIGSGLTVLGDVFLQWFEHYHKGVEFTWESLDTTRTLRNGLIGAGIGTGIGYLSYNHKKAREANQDFQSDSFLKKVLKEEDIKNEHDYFRATLDYRRQVKEYLSNVYGCRLAMPPEDVGSFHKGTAIGSNYDLDVILAFRRNQFATLSEMYLDVLYSLQVRFKDEAEINKQRKSIGLTFFSQGFEFHFDIVPGREINNYRFDKKLNLFVRPDWFWQAGSLAKSHVGLDKSIVANKPLERDVIKLIKTYRDRNRLYLPTVIIEQCVVKALSVSNYGVSQSKKENLLNSMQYISKRLENYSLRDVNNTNNDLLKGMSSYQIFQVINVLKTDILRIERDQRYLVDVFDL